MRKQGILISERKLMFAIAGQLFDQAPNRQPRNAEIIMTKVRDAFREKASNDNGWYSMYIEEDKVEEVIRGILFEIPEFKDLNLSQIEMDKKVSVDDDSRPKYSFSSNYICCDECDDKEQCEYKCDCNHDVETADSWKSDFIDLDAFIQNVLCNIYMLIDNDTDCFCCKFNDTDSCNHDGCDNVINKITK